MNKLEEEMKKVILVGLLVLILVSLSIFGGCSSAATSTTNAVLPTPSGSLAVTSATAASQPAASASQPASQSVQTPVTAAKTLKIGLVLWEGWFVGVDTLRAIELYVDMENAKGGFDIGGEKYKIDLIAYDNNNTKTTEVAAVNRLVFEDKVQYIISGGSYCSAWLPVTEKNKVIVLTYQPDWQQVLDPQYHYVFSPSFMNTQITSFTGWLNSKYPDLVKNIVFPLQDNGFGHSVEAKETPVWKSLGVTPTFIYYPATQTDLSSAATKVMELNPTAVNPTSTDNLMIKALYQAGYKGLIYEDAGTSVQTLASMVPIEALEGYISCAEPMEFETTPVDAPLAKEYKAAWIAKYGSWTNAEVGGIAYCGFLKSALQKAGTLDTDKMADMIAEGLAFDTPVGAGQMISRPDLGIDRAVDSIATNYVKQVKDGNPVLLDTISIEAGLKSFRAAYPAK